MKMIRKHINLDPAPRGCHLITAPILEQLPEIHDFQSGMLQIFICHTSASLCINENASPDVRRDLEAILNYLLPENLPFIEHDYEGPDDMPAHAKAAILGSDLLIPVERGMLALGTWQGIYLCEHRNHGGRRKLILSLWGD
jgi:secondary thiamine-phosphate synthase enzyme